MSDPKTEGATPAQNDPTKIKPRLTIVETISHQKPGGQPVSANARYSRQLETHEQVYQRELVATEEWQPLVDSGCWLDGCSHIVVENTEGHFLQVNPTDEERAEATAKVLEVALCQDRELQFGWNWQVPPKETFRGTPSNTSLLWVRSQSGETRFTLTVFPR